ncbi:MAG: AAA family ATPase, partial [bacterium]|nr:AAA family ATPase [bacterium]
NRSGDQIKCHDKYVEVWDLEQQIADLFKYIEFTPSFKERLVARIEKTYSSRKEVINKEKRSLNTQKMLLEKKRDVAEEKLFASLITDDDFTRVKVKIKEQVEAIQDEIYKQDKKLNMRIDELQDVLLFARNAYEAFVKAPAELQRLFLGLYWDRFEVTDKKVVTVLPTPIIRGLMLAEDMVFTKKYQEIREPRIITDMTVEFTAVVAGKSKSKLAPKTQKSRRNAEIPVMVSNQPDSVILDTVWGLATELNKTDDVKPPLTIYSLLPKKIPRIVLTGGPCSGKTTVMQILAKELSNIISFVPEVATILIGQLGINPFPKDRLRIHRFNANIYRTQRIFEGTSVQEAQSEGKQALVLDRGTIDIAAYLPGGLEEMEDICQTKRGLEFDQYDLVICLEVPPEYVYEEKRRNNPTRSENYEKAFALGERIKESWEEHPNFHIIPNGKTINAKAEVVRRLIQELIAQ